MNEATNLALLIEQGEDAQLALHQLDAGLVVIEINHFPLYPFL